MFDQDEKQAFVSPCIGSMYQQDIAVSFLQQSRLSFFKHVMQHDKKNYYLIFKRNLIILKNEDLYSRWELVEVGE